MQFIRKADTQTPTEGTRNVHSFRGPMKPAFLTWLIATKRRDARITRQYAHNVPTGTV